MKEAAYLILSLMALIFVLRLDGQTKMILGIFLWLICVVLSMPESLKQRLAMGRKGEAADEEAERPGGRQDKGEHS